MASSLKILVVGGYGTFGGRLVELLEGEAGLELVVAGRSLQKATAYCAARAGAKARLTPAVFDRAAPPGPQLAAHAPDILVDASGPFQDYGREGGEGGDGYALVRACIAQGVHYLDLADGSAFVEGIARFDEDAKKAGVFVLSGVSSFPVLTAAVVRHLAREMDDVLSIRGGIAPSPYAGVGGNVIRAIAGYAGQEITLRQAGCDTRAWPLTSSCRYTIAPPGFLPLQNTLFSLVDVPDLRVLAAIWPKARIWMGAGPVPEILHRTLIAFAWLVRYGALRSLLPLAPLMALVIRTVRWGEHRGGMFVEVAGEKGGAPVKRAWHLLAEGRDGPLIPSMAVEAVVRKRLAGQPVAPGARAATGDITLADYDALFARRTIHTGTRDDAPLAKTPLYRRILGSAWEGLPPQIRAMHDVADAAAATGRARIARGTNPLGALACRILGFPPAGEDVPVTVRFTVHDGAEKWARRFGDDRFHSVQSAGRGRNERLVVERFGILSFAMALVPEEGRLCLVLRRWSILGLPLPMWLCVKSDSFEYVDAEGRFNFDVRISHPLTGLIVHYQGWLVPDVPESA